MDIKLAMTILFVKDQSKSTEFYKLVLGTTPDFEVPGMTQFTFSNGGTLGLMPEAGIKRILGEKMPDPHQGSGIPRSELYLTLKNPEEVHQKILQSGGSELSPYLPRNWGDTVAYSMDLDGHVIALAQERA